MKKAKFTDHIKAQAAIAWLISEGWGIDLAKLNKEIPGGLKPQDWIAMANECMDWCFNKMAEDKVIPIARFLADAAKDSAHD